MLRPACWAYAACGLLCGPTPLSLRERDGVPSYIESTVDGQGWSMTVRRPSLLTPSKSSVSRGVRALQIFLPAKTARQSPSLFIVSTYLAPLLHTILFHLPSCLPLLLCHPPSAIHLPPSPSTTIHSILSLQSAIHTSGPLDLWCL